MEEVKISHLNISRTFGFETKNSSDLDVGRRPELKSDEFFISNPIVIEVSRCESLFTVVKVVHLLGASLRPETKSVVALRFCCSEV